MVKTCLDHGFSLGFNLVFIGCFSWGIYGRMMGIHHQILKKMKQISRFSQQFMLDSVEIGGLTRFLLVGWGFYKPTE